MNVLHEIRPRADHLTDEHSRALLDSVLNSPEARRKPRWNRVAAFGLCGVLVAGGTAYATGLVPEIVTDRFQQMGDDQDGWPDPITGERLIADVQLSNGKQARVWHADTTDGQCVIRDRRGAATRPEDFGVGCARWNDDSEASGVRRGVHWQTSTDGLAVVYGEFNGAAADVAAVRVAGPDWTKSFRVDDGAFAGEVPPGADGDRIRFTYLDPRAQPIASEVITVTIESE
ncbi:hypothetical protein [Nocardioides sp.]|uniref:hypothetical protein n=1 Tax=Nocardioides sp. TaxID=35761 RepID=UPI002733ABDC|nr:hypothetical protein [Nocardioides sp.]MDP3893587.1 hypothetical protein [Nocardioides sp.]